MPPFNFSVYFFKLSLLFPSNFLSLNDLTLLTEQWSCLGKTDKGAAVEPGLIIVLSQKRKRGMKKESKRKRGGSCSNCFRPGQWHGGGCVCVGGGGVIQLISRTNKRRR